MTLLAAAADQPRGTRARGLFLVFVAGLLYASAGVFTRALPFDAWTLVAWRSLAGGLYTALAFAVESGRLDWRDYAMGPLHWLMVPLGAVGACCYIVALTLTSVADVMVVYATTPFVTALIAWLWNKEVPTRRLLIASTIALGGVVVMIGGGGPPSPGRLTGTVLILAMNVTFSLLLVLARRYPGRSMMPVNALSLLLAGAIGFAMAPHQTIGFGSLALLLVFGVVTVGIAMSLFLAGARLAPSSEVALIGISDVVLGPIMVFALFGEDPGASAILGGAVVIVALVWNVWPDLRRLLAAAMT